MALGGARLKGFPKANVCMMDTDADWLMCDIGSTLM